MRPLQLTWMALATALLCSTITSCDSGDTPTEPADLRLLPDQRPPPTLPIADRVGADPFSASCPMVVSDAKVEVTDTERGVALTFTTETGDTSDLRTRVQRLAQRYERHHREAGMSWHPTSAGGMGTAAMGNRGMDRASPAMSAGGMGKAGMGGDGMDAGGMAGTDNGHPPMGGTGMAGAGAGSMAHSVMPPASTTTVDIDKGARLELRPKDATQLDALREQVRWHQERMSSGACWISQAQPTDMPPEIQE